MSRGDDESTLMRGFAFRVKLFRSTGAAGATGRESVPSGESQLGDGAFQECSGLQIDLDVQEYLEGGRNDGVIRRVGRAKYQPITLKRGMFYSAEETADASLWSWLQSIASGEGAVRRYDGLVEVLSGAGDRRVVASWVFERGLPVRVSGPALNARSGEIVIEELQIAHEGLRFVSPSSGRS